MCNLSTKLSKIALITPNYFPEIGACSYRMQHLAKELQKAGHQVEVFTVLPNYPTGKIFKKYTGKFSVKEEIEGISVRRYWFYANHSSKSILRVLSLVSLSLMLLVAIPRLFKFKTEIIIVQSPPLFLALSAWFMSKIVSAKYILNLSDLRPRAFLDLGFLQKSSFLYRILLKVERFLYKKSKLILGQSQEIITHVKTIFPDAETLLYRNGVEQSGFIDNTPNFEAPLKIVYAGLLGISQGFLMLCQEIDFKDLGVELHIYGDGFERNKIEKYLKEEIQKNIFIHDALQSEQLKKELIKYDIALVVQKKQIYGTVPSKIYEAMALGLPILLAGKGESAEIINENKVGWTALPSDYEMLKESIIKIKKLDKKTLILISDEAKGSLRSCLIKKYLSRD